MTLKEKYKLVMILKKIPAYMIMANSNEARDAFTSFACCAVMDEIPSEKILTACLPYIPAGALEADDWMFCFEMLKRSKAA